MTDGCFRNTGNQTATDSLVQLIPGVSAWPLRITRYDFTPSSPIPSADHSCIDKRPQQQRVGQAARDRVTQHLENNEERKIERVEDEFSNDGCDCENLEMNGSHSNSR